jgi:RNA polymerase sigma factor (sigma-70 family)
MKRSSKLPVLRHYRALFESGSYCGLSDGELLSRFLTRDGESAELAFAVLVERHASAVLRICKAIAGNESDAEDAFQATFLVLATKAGRLIVHETLGPWLASVARRISRRARATALAQAARELRAARLAETRASPIADSADDARVLHEEIDRLPERYRLPLLLCDLESQSHQEAARTLGWPLGTVKSRQARARQRLRLRLSRRGLSGSVPTAFAFKAARSSIPESLIQATASAAASLVSRGTAAKAVSASVSTLVTSTLRAMIMTRLSLLLGAILTISAGVAATVAAQTFPDKNKPSTNSPLLDVTGNPTPAPPAPAVFEYEIRIFKDGVAVTPTTKMRVVPGEASRLDTTAGIVDVRFEPRLASAGNAHHFSADEMRDLATVLDQRLKLFQELEKTLKDGQIAPPQVERAQLQANLKNLLQDRAAAENADHEKRLAEIERKLERILNVLDRLPAKAPGTRDRAPRE